MDDPTRDYLLSVGRNCIQQVTDFVQLCQFNICTAT